MSSAATSSTRGRCGLNRNELKGFNWVTSEGCYKALCQDESMCGDLYSKHAAAATGWSPRLVGVELNPGPCHGAINEGKCEQGCTLSPKEVKEFKSDGICDCGHSYLRHGVLTSQSTGDWVRDLTREGVEANPGPCNGGTDAINGKCPQNCAVFVPNEEKKNSCDYCKHHKACHTDVAGSINVPSEIIATLEKAAEKTISEALSKFQTPQKTRKAEVRSTEKQKSLLRRLRKRNPDQVCDICGKGYPGMIGAHVVPWALRDALEEYYDNQPESVQQLLPTSSFHESNGLILCPTCDKAFELHEIDIEPDGRITVEPARRSSFSKLHNSHVVWSSSIDRDLRFPTSELLKYRKTLPKATSWIGKRALGLIPFTRDEGKKRRKREQEDDEVEKAEKEEEKQEEEEEEEQEEVDITALKTAGFSDVEISSLRSALSAEQLRHATRVSKDPMLQRGRPMRRDRYVEQMEKQGWELSLDTGAVMYFFHPDTCRVWVRLRGG